VCFLQQKGRTWGRPPVSGPAGWNRIEHRLFAFITKNWRGKPLVSHQAIVQLIGATTTPTPRWQALSSSATRSMVSGTTRCARAPSESERLFMRAA
jgi:hypothetical protein